MVGALVVSLVSGLIIAVAIIKKGERLDTVIGTIWAVGMSVGLICIHITPGYQDPMSYLFGNILLISQSDLLVIIVLNVMIILTSVLFHNQFLAVFFDEEFARLRGTRTAVYHIMLIVLVSLTVILMIIIIGIVMVIALLTIPAAIAGMFAKRMKAMMVAAVIICALIMMSGLAVSYLVKLPTGSVTVVLAGATYVLAKLGKRLVR
jgi:zinc transport system permease protein